MAPLFTKVHLCYYQFEYMKSSKFFQNLYIVIVRIINFRFVIRSVGRLPESNKA